MRNIVELKLPSCLALPACLICVSHLYAQHADDFVIGSSGGSEAHLIFELDEDVLAEPIILAPNELDGFSTNSPGFDSLAADEPEHGIYKLGAGARIWLQIFSEAEPPALGDLHISPAMFIYDSASWTFFPYEESGTVYREVYLGTETLHKHVSWFLDALDPAYDPTRCVWELTARFIDKGTTNYGPSEPFTLRFALHRLVPGDFDCDGDVDDDDLALFEACHSGPAVPLSTECLKFDLDGDADADAVDFAILQRCLSGAGIPGNPDCRN